MRIPSTRSLEAFVAVVRCGSLSSAGADIGMSIPAVSRRIAALEADLGTRLFERHPKGLALTQVGESYHAQAVAAMDLLRAAGEGLRRADRDVVRLTTFPAFATRWLLPRLPTFVSSHPEVEVEVKTSLAYEDLVAHDIDLAIRIAPDDYHAGVELLPIHLMPVWSPAYLAPVSRPSDLRGSTLLSPEHRPEFWCEWLDGHGLDVAAMRVRHVDPLLLYELALTGAGVAIGIEPLATALLDQGRLEGMDSHRLRSSRSLRLMANQRHPSRAVVRFRDWLRLQIRTSPVVR